MLENTLRVFQALEDGTYSQLNDMQVRSITKTLAASATEVLIFSDVVKRQIWIWTGINAPVRKKFVSSRIANQLKFEIGAIANTQSIEQGDEPQAFWDFIEMAPDGEIKAIEVGATPLPSTAQTPTQTTPPPQEELKPKRKLVAKAATAPPKEQRKEPVSTAKPVISDAPVVAASASQMGQIRTFAVPGRHVSTYLTEEIPPEAAIKVTDTTFVGKIMRQVILTPSTPSGMLRVYEVREDSPAVNVSQLAPFLVLRGPQDGSTFQIPITHQVQTGHSLYLSGPKGSFVLLNFES